MSSPCLCPLRALLIVGALAVLTGCETAPPSFIVQASTSATPLGKSSTDTDSSNRYVIKYVNSLTQRLIAPYQGSIIQGLSEKGYHPATSREQPDVVVWIGAMLDETQLVKVPVHEGPIMADNPDSIRHKNVAGLMGRYRQLLHDNPNASGEMMLGPDGEVIMTGNLKNPGGEDIEYQAPQTRVSVARQRSAVAIWATATRAPVDANDSGERWRVEVVSELPADAPPPEIEALVLTAVSHIASNTKGPTKVPVPPVRVAAKSL